MDTAKANLDELIIHVSWSGPHTYEKGLTFKGPTDCGLYQIYGNHPVYGSSVLLYIGMTQAHHFGGRGVLQHGEYLGNQNAGGLEYYFGRLIGHVTPSSKTWDHHILLAERLLIHAHRPAWNSQMKLGSLEKELQLVHVVNWDNYRSLLPEVSGARWTTIYDDLSIHRYYSTDHFKRMNS